MNYTDATGFDISPDFMFKFCKSKIGYSCWGFLGDGITDTPDGGRSHRAYLIKTILEQSYQVIMLQANRDLLEARESVQLGQTYDTGFPEIDLLFLEWRWIIPNRNDRKENPYYTPDWFRQLELIEHYYTCSPILIWDKDQSFSKTPKAVLELLSNGRTYIMEPSLMPSKHNRISALFPFNPDNYKKDCQLPNNRSNSLIYIGNDYNRRGDFRRFLLTAGKQIDIKVFGKWNNPIGSKYIQYHGRIPFSRVHKIYGNAVATFLLAPPRYKKTGQFTQRLYEAICEGCLPIGPSDYYGIEQVLEPSLIVESGSDIPGKVEWIRNLNSENYIALLTRQRAKLKLFSAAKILEYIQLALDEKLPTYHINDHIQRRGKI